MKYKIKIIQVDESQDDWEYYIDFMFLDNGVRYWAELIGSGYSKIIKSFLGKEVTADLVLNLPACKSNKEKKSTWLSLILKHSFDYTEPEMWINPADIIDKKELSCVYLCSGKMIGMHLDDVGNNYYRLQSERLIDVSTDIFKQNGVKPNIQIGEYYSFRGILTIQSIDEGRTL